MFLFFTLIFCPHRCKITVEELARRVGPPEYMSFSSLVAYLRADNNTRKELQAQLEEVGIKPSDLTTEITLFSRLCEGKLLSFVLLIVRNRKHLLLMLTTCCISLCSSIHQKRSMRCARASPTLCRIIFPFKVSKSFLRLRMNWSRWEGLRNSGMFQTRKN